MSDEKPVQMPVIKGIDPNKLAEELCSVQPMPGDIMANLYKAAKSLEELRAEGYQPVSNLGLMWIKMSDDERRNQ